MMDGGNQVTPVLQFDSGSTAITALALDDTASGELLYAGCPWYAPASAGRTVVPTLTLCVAAVAQLTATGPMQFALLPVPSLLAAQRYFYAVTIRQVVADPLKPQVYVLSTFVTGPDFSGQVSQFLLLYTVTTASLPLPSLPGFRNRLFCLRHSCHTPVQWCWTQQMASCT
jgi:hypothetical protein